MTAGVVDTCITLRLLEIRHVPCLAIGVVAHPFERSNRGTMLRGRMNVIRPAQHQHIDIEQSASRRPRARVDDILGSHRRRIRQHQKPEIRQPRDNPNRRVLRANSEITAPTCLPTAGMLRVSF